MPTTSSNLSQALKQPAIFCLAWSLICIASTAFGETADSLPLNSELPVTVLTPDDTLTANQQDSEGEDPIVVNLDIPPELAAFLDEQGALDGVNSTTATTGLANSDTSNTPDAALEVRVSPDTVTKAFGADQDTAETQSAAQSLEPALQELQDPLQDLPYRVCFFEAAQTYQVDELLLIGIAIVESSLDANAVSSSDALGLMQIKWPITANHLGIEDRQALFDPCTNVDAGARYLRELLDDLSSFGQEPRMRLALASYRLGPNGFDPNVPLPSMAQDYIGRVQAQRDSLVMPAENAATASVSGPVLPCLVQNLRQLTAITHDPSQRNAQFGNWLKARGQGCSALALIQIRNNMPTWLGTGLTPELEAQVQHLLASSINEPEREASRRNSNRR